MSNNIPLNKIRNIHQEFLKGKITIRSTAKRLKISRRTLRAYLNKLGSFKNNFPDKLNDFKEFYRFVRDVKSIPDRQVNLIQLFPKIYSCIRTSDSSLKNQWKMYKSMAPDGYSYSQFTFYYSKWINKNKSSIESNTLLLSSILNANLKILKKWKLSNDKKEWEIATALIDFLKGRQVLEISAKIERSKSLIRKWIKLYKKEGLDGFKPKTRNVNKDISQNIEIKKSNLIKLIHE